MITTFSRVQIQRPVQDVFDFVTDPAKALLWHTGSLEMKGEKGLPAGSTGVVVTLAMGRQIKSRFEVLENDGQSIMRSRSTQGPLSFRTTYELKPVSAGRTKFTVRTEIDAGFIFNLAEPVLQSIAQTRIEADLKTLKAVMENLA